jgi:hypothetical protein
LKAAAIVNNDRNCLSQLLLIKALLRVAPQVLATNPAAVFQLGQPWFEKVTWGPAQRY